MCMAKITSVSLGDRTELLEEITHREDRSKSSVLRRVIDYYYMMNYLPRTEGTAEDKAEIQAAKRDYRAGRVIPYRELSKKLHDGMDTTNHNKGRKGASQTR